MQKYIEEAGAIVLRKTAGGFEVLLILSKKKPAMRIFPKGHIEAGETPAVAATRELLEEAGIEGRLLREAPVITYEFRGKWYRVAYFYFEYERCVSGGEEGRNPGWYSLSEARAAIELTDLRMLLSRTSIETARF